MRRNKKRRAVRSQPSRDIIKNHMSIHERSQEADQRTELGHWEGDLVICQRMRPVLVLHERKTRVTFAARLIGKGAAETANIIMNIFRRLDPQLRQSVTVDNDTDFARHRWLREALSMATFGAALGPMARCAPHSATPMPHGKRAGVENANGRFRHWLPRQTNLDNISDEDMAEIVVTYNLTLRKCLAYRTPLQALFSELGIDVRLRFD